MRSIKNKNSGVYKLFNKITGRVYIGYSIDMLQARCYHFSSLKMNRHLNAYIQEEYEKYGKDSLIFEVIEYCEKENSICKKQYWMDFYKSYNKEYGYNMIQKADRSEYSLEMKDKMRKSLMGNTYMLGKKASIETKEKMRKSKLEYFKNKKTSNISGGGI